MEELLVLGSRNGYCCVVRLLKGVEARLYKHARPLSQRLRL